MQIDSPATLVTAFSAAVVGLASVHQTRVGKRQEREAQQVANDLQRKAQDHDVYRDMVADLERQVDRRDHELTELREERTELRREYAASLAHLGDIITTLRDVVHSEIATSLADDGINAAEHALDEDPKEPR